MNNFAKLFPLFLIILLAAKLYAQNSVAASKATAAVSYDTIAGDLPASVPAGEKPYYVVSDIYVPQGKTVEIGEGTVFLFKNFAGMQIQGKLIAKGSKENPVIFTSENDNDFNRHESPDAAPFDWNGIYIHSDAIGSELHNCRILYSVDGLVSETRFVRLNECLFRENGRASLTIEGVEHEVGDKAYDYALSVKAAKLEGEALSVLSDPMATRRNIFRYSGIALAVGGAVVGIVFSSNYNEASRLLDNLSSRDPQNLAQNSSDDWNAARDDKRRNLGGALVGWGVMVIGGIGFSISMTF